jgi:hypothetical protein
MLSLLKVVQTALLTCAALCCLQVVQWPVHCERSGDSCAVLRALQGGSNRPDGVLATNDAQDGSFESLRL